MSHGTGESPVFPRVAVLGLGLLGGSVAAAARRRGGAGHVVGCTRRSDALELALHSGIVDEAVGDAAEAVRAADLVVLATPVYAMAGLVRRLAPQLREGVILTDVGSVKATLADTLPGLLPPGVHYVGSHPMAGSHRRGLEHAREDLFDGSICVVMSDADAAARERVAGFWRAVGCRVVWRDAASHDAEVAWMSHVPHAMAFAFAAALDRVPTGASEVQGSGFRDFTRIAHSDPELWADILSANGKAVAAPLQAAGRALAELSRLLEQEDVEALERFLAAARAALSRAGVRSPDSPQEPPEPPTVERSGGDGD